MNIQDVYKKVSEFKDIFYKYDRSGVCDTEGSCAVASWVERKVKNLPDKPLTFERLEGYTVYTPKWARESDLERGYTPADSYPTKRQVAAAVSKAAGDLAAYLAKACRAGVIDPDQVYGLLR